jgi:hypothetical protein
MPDDTKITIAQEYQQFLYGLFQKHVMTLEGPVISDTDQPPCQHISKDILIEKLLLVFNEFGEAVNSDERLKK